ncbi:pseudouridine synthase A [Seminavis robusta]|uniref:Pseudouridine synthase A n=1 Tax=Seminavis robusta TaxID=568900 RepID=A0A9N8DRU6_9STRA|nr:pseudouridine synthase A [Seminavis robusta]|eukprot:Sro208_g087160.1 pseudouridine synthase A (513) ;mRNA; f:71405-72943
MATSIDDNDTTRVQQDNHKKASYQNNTTNKQDSHVHVFLSLEYHGTNYGGWQRQGPKNHVVYPSVQGTLEQAATQVCRSFHTSNSQIPLVATNDETGDCVAVLSQSSGRTDRGVHALDHQCVLRLPFAAACQHEEPFQDFFVTSPSLFLRQLNQALPSDIHVRTCQLVANRQQRKQLRFLRKRYTYLIQQAPQQQHNHDDNNNNNNNNNKLLNRPWHPWNDYTYFVKETMNVDHMKQALQYMMGTHDFLPLACEKGIKTSSGKNGTRTLHQGTITVVSSTTAGQQPEQQHKLPWFSHAVRRPHDERNKKKRKKETNDNKSNKKALNNNAKDVPASTLESSTSTTTQVTPTPTSEAPVAATTTTTSDTSPPCIFEPPLYGSRSQIQQQQQQQQQQSLQIINERPKVQENQNRLQPQHYTILQIDLEGNGFLRHQVRRMVSVLIKVGAGTWPPEIVQQILSKGDPKFLQGMALAPSRALWKTRVTHSFFLVRTTSGSAANNIEDAVDDGEDDDE